MTKVFISFAREDAGIAEALSAALHSGGLDVSEPLQTSISDAIAQSHGFVLLIGPQALRSSHCRSEWSIALEASWQDTTKKIFPVLLGGVRPPAFISDVTSMRMASDADLTEIADQVKQALSATAPEIDHEDFTTASARQLITFDGLRRIAFSPEGSLLATGGSDSVVRLWDPESGSLGAELVGHQGPVRALAFSPEGSLLATGGSDSVVRLWDPESGSLGAELVGHQGPVRALAFSPDTRLLATAGADSTVRIWEIAGPAHHAGRGRLAATLRHDQHVGDVRFAPDGLCVFSTISRAVYAWDVPSARQRRRLSEVEAGARSLKPGKRELAERAAVLTVMLNVQRRTLGDSDPAVAATLVNLAITRRELGRYEEAYETFRTALALQRRLTDPDGAPVASTLFNLAVCSRRLGRVDEAYTVLHQALDLQRRTLGPASAPVASTLFDIAVCSRDLGRFDEAHALLQEARDLRRLVLGPDHPSVASTLIALADISRRLGRYDDAYTVLRQALDLQRRVLGPDHPSVVSTLTNLAMISRELGHDDEARAQLIDVREIRRRNGSSDDPADDGMPRDAAGKAGSERSDDD